jgi:glycosyltransferase involved in cell wall biosynthesis
LDGIRKLSHEYSIDPDVIIVDAGSTDETLAISKEYSTKVIVSSGVSRGKARNIGAEKAINDAIAFLDSDCIITVDWIEHLLTLPTEMGSTVVAGPASLVESNTTFGSIVRDMLSSRFFTLSYTFSLDSDQKEVDDVPSSNMLISKKFFNQIDGFPDLNFNEDGVFCKRVLAGNGKITYFPRFKVIHKKTFNKITKFAHYFFQYGESYAKNLKLYPNLLNRYGLFAACLPILLVFTFVALILFDLASLPFLATFMVSGYLILLCYSLIIFRKIHAGLIPLLFVTLSISYLTGFYYGTIKSIRKTKPSR